MAIKIGREKFMKKSILLLITMVLLVGLIGCTRPAGKEEVESRVGYIVIDGNDLQFKEIEIVEWEDRDKMDEYNLSDDDMEATGFVFIEKPGSLNYQLAEEVDYIFTDVHLNFIEEEDGDRIYHTRKKEEFLRHLAEYDLNDIPLEEQTIPYFIEISGGKVTSIREEFKYTI